MSGPGITNFPDGMIAAGRTKAAVVKGDHIPIGDSEDGNKVKVTSVEAIYDLIAGTPPETLDTLAKLAAAINNDPNFHTTLATALAGKAPLADPEFTGVVRSGPQLTKLSGINQWILRNPSGAALTGSSDSSGKVKIMLPNIGVGVAYLVSVEIEVFDYTAGGSYSVVVDGFFQTTGNWTRGDARAVFGSISTLKPHILVGFGADDGRGVITLENTATARQYMRVRVPRVMISWVTDPTPFLGDWSVSVLTASDSTVYTITRTCYRPLNAEETQIINGRQYFRNAQGNVMYGPATPTPHDPLLFGLGDQLVWKVRQELAGHLDMYHWDGSAFTKSARWSASTKSLELLNEPTAPTAAPGTNTQQLATTAFVQAALTGASGVPAGVICMWSGTIATVPSGWALCDGTNGTPDLVDRFVVAAGSKAGGDKYDPGDTGGADSVTLDLTQIPAHTHAGTTGNGGTHYHDVAYWNGSSGPNPMIDKRDSAFGSGGENPNWSATDWHYGHTHGFTTDSKGGGGSHENRPPYYALAFIMKL